LRAVDIVAVVKAFASLTTVVAAVLVASNWSPKVMVAGFAVFVVASLAWIGAGWFESQPSIYVQNLVLLVVNVIGIFRWLPRAEAE
jgi:hypothetical protein